MKKRCYLHGDLHESLTQKYYCALCDAFEEKMHFNSTTHKSINIDKYTNSLTLFKKANAKFSKFFFRSPQTVNLFSNSETFQAKPSKFYNWLKKQNKRDDVIGDLACGILSDEKFPVEHNDYNKIRIYLNSKNACSEAILALKDAYGEFNKTKKNRDNISLKLRFEIFKRDKYKCCLCGASPRQNDVQLEIDHKIPISKNGSNEKENLWTLCFNCNRGKGSEYI